MTVSSVRSEYIGRFAPSPTGLLHFGSLVCAMGSYLQARKHCGQWLLRIEDIDPPREVVGASDAIVHSLERLGFEWDGAVSYQSQRQSLYDDAIDQLQAQLYACNCSRKTLAAYRRQATAHAKIANTVYPGICRHRQLPPKNHALRIRACGEVDIDDAIQGRIHVDLSTQVGDFVVRRRDGLFAYHLAVVVDDAQQGVSEVVRGADLLAQTPSHIHLQRCLGLPTPRYCHLPVATDPSGQKLSKQNGAKPIDTLPAIALLINAWRFLGQTRFEETPINIEEFWSIASTQWQLDHVPRSMTEKAEGRAYLG